MIIQAGRYLINLDHMEWADFSHQDEVWFYFHDKDAPLGIHNEDARAFKKWAERSPDLTFTTFKKEESP